MNSLRHFKDFLKLNSLFSKPMKLNSLLNIYLFCLVILYEHYEADTEADKVAPHVYGSFCTFYLYGVLLQWLAKTFLITLLQQGLTCTSVKAILGGLQNKIDSVSPVQICDRSCETLTFLCYPCAVKIMFAMLRYCCSCQLKFSGSIYRPNFSYRLHFKCSLL